MALDEWKHTQGADSSPRAATGRRLRELRRHPVGRWLLRFLVFFIVYWALAPFTLFWFSYTWHWIESVAFGLVAASIHGKEQSRRMRARPRA
jgi:hypothetical protein